MNGLTRRVFAVPTRGEILEMAAIEIGRLDRPIDIVFLHANGFCARTYAAALAPLADRFHVLAVDQRGHGGTPQAKPAAPRADMLDLRDDLIGLLDLLGGPPPLLSGHSLGGCVSVFAAAERPDLVRGLILFDPVILSRSYHARAAGADALPPEENQLAARSRRRRRTFADRRQALAEYQGRPTFAGWADGMLADYLADGLRDRPGGGVELACDPEWEASNYAAHGHDVWLDLARLRRRLHILRAATGSTCALAEAADLPGPDGLITVEPIPGTTHFLPMQRPDLVCARLAAAASVRA